MKLKFFKFSLILIIFLGISTIFALKFTSSRKFDVINQSPFTNSPRLEKNPNSDNPFFDDVATKAETRLFEDITYDGSYIAISYPLGDVPPNIGVCTDVVIRSYRLLGIDLQERVHLDMKKDFSSYPKNWGLTSTDTNIDHRRVLNLMTYFTRMGASLPITNNSNDYLPGHIVSWDLGGGLNHIGIVSSKISKESGNPMIVHNIGSGPKLDDILFQYEIIGHYRYGSYNI